MEREGKLLGVRPVFFQVVKRIKHHASHRLSSQMRNLKDHLTPPYLSAPTTDPNPAESPNQEGDQTNEVIE
jgi:hypothetical protein